MILSELAPLVSAQHGVFYSMTDPADGGEPVLELQAGYGYEERKHLSTSFRLGEGLVGQCAKEKKRILLTDVPGDYVRINSGLGASTPLNIIVLPVLFEGSVRAVIELASFSPFSVTHQAFLDSAHREHRPRAQHDRGRHAHREPAQAVAVAGRGAALAAGGAARVERGPRTPGDACSPSRTSRPSRRTRRSRSRSAWSRRRPASSRSRRSTSRSSSRTCRTSCARR